MTRALVGHTVGAGRWKQGEQRGRSAPLTVAKGVSGPPSPVRTRNPRRVLSGAGSGWGGYSSGTAVAASIGAASSALIRPLTLS